MDVNTSPVSEYNSFSEVLQETRDVMVVDLVRYSIRLSQNYLDMLAPDPAGVYTIGKLEPILIFDGSHHYYTIDHFRTNPSQPNILCFDDFINAKTVIVNHRGKPVCRPPIGLKQYFQDHCSFRYSAIWLAASHIWNILRSLSQHTEPNSPVPGWKLNEAQWIKDGKVQEFYAAKLPDLDDLTDSLYRFIGRDYFNIYSLLLSDTTAHIQKGNDFRVISYYRTIFEEHEAKRFEQLGY